MPPEELELFRRLQTGDVDAVRILFEEYRPRVYRVCLHYTGNAEDARDIVQETFVRAFRAVGQFRGDSTLATWLTRIAMNLCLNFRRDRRTATTLLDQREDMVRANMPPIAPRRSSGPRAIRASAHISASTTSSESVIRSASMITRRPPE